MREYLKDCNDILVRALTCFLPYSKVVSNVPIVNNDRISSDDRKEEEGKSTVDLREIMAELRRRWKEQEEIQTDE